MNAVILRFLKSKLKDFEVHVEKKTYRKLVGFPQQPIVESVLDGPNPSIGHYGKPRKKKQ